MATKKAVRAKKPRNEFAEINRKLHLVSTVVLALLSVGLMYGIKATHYPVSMSYVTHDTLKTEHPLFVPAERVVRDVDIRWILIALFATGIVYSLLVLTRWAPSYEKAQNGRIYLWRWVYFAIVGTLLIKLVSVISGVEDMATIKATEGLLLFAAAFAWLCERQNEKAKQRSSWSTYILAAAAVLFGLMPLVELLLGTTIYGMISLPWYVYALFGTLVAAVILVGINLVWSFTREKKTAYGKIERNYIAIALLVQMSVALVAFLAFRTS
jgi:MFS family permease